MAAHGRARTCLGFAVISQLSQEIPQVIISRLILESVAKDLSFEVGEAFSVAEAKIMSSLLYFDISDVLEFLVNISTVCQAGTWKVSSFHQVDQQVKQRYQIISPARRVELELVDAREDHVAAEDV